MIKFPINPQDNGSLLKIQAPFLRAYLSTGNTYMQLSPPLSAEAGTPQHRRGHTWILFAMHNNLLISTRVPQGAPCLTYRSEPAQDSLRDPGAHTRSSCSELWRSPVPHTRWQTSHTVSQFSVGLASQIEARLTSLWKPHPRHLMNCIQETHLQ